jgi:hypothetical protein
VKRVDAWTRQRPFVANQPVSALQLAAPERHVTLGRSVSVARFLSSTRAHRVRTV